MSQPGRWTQPGEAGYTEITLGALLAAIFLGVAGLLTVTSIEALRRYGRIESNTAMGVVFSIALP